MYPSDVVQLWQDHYFISNLVSHLKLSQNARSPTFKFDPIYADVLSSHPRLLFALSVFISCVWAGDHFDRLSFALELSDLSYKVFGPFLSFRGILEFPFPEGDSPVDFLVDPRRARDLYFNRANVSETLVLLWIHRAKEVLTGSDCRLTPYVISYRTHCLLTLEILRSFLVLLDGCVTNFTILRELQSLNLVHLCNRKSKEADEGYHENAHRDMLHPETLSVVLDWLWVSHLLVNQGVSQRT